MGPALSTRSCTARPNVGAHSARNSDQQHGDAAGGIHRTWPEHDQGWSEIDQPGTFLTTQPHLYR